MRYLAKASALVAILVLFVPSLILGADYISEAADALKQTRVYVFPGTEGTDNGTVNRLKARLTSDDNIVLVMLPFAAESELGADAFTIVTRLSEVLGNQRIIGLAVGRTVVGYAPTLSEGVASDLMNRARSVSNNDPFTALGTFVQNVHIWQRAHPQPKPILSETTSAGVPFGVLASVAVITFLVILVIIYFARRTEAEEEVGPDRTSYKVPAQVKDQLYQIARLRRQVLDRELKAVLYQICVDIEKYFQLSSNNKKTDAVIFKDRLTDVVQVLSKYVEVQDNPDYFNDPEIVLSRWKEAFSEFSQFVREAIRRGTEADLRAYRLKAEVMQAQRSAASPDQ